jgi:hypothetical protein
MDEIIDLYSGDSADPPYLTVTANSNGGIIVSYNFTQQSRITTNATVEYWDEHIVAQLDTGFEDGVFGPAWTTFGSPVVTASYAPYEGLYHAGASFGDSGVGNHTFEAAINGTGFFNLTLSYYRKLQIVGGGTVSFIADWYNGTAWNGLENITATSPYALSTWELNSTADNNPDLIFRFNVTLTAGSINNGAWIDNPTLISKSGFHQHSNSTAYPTEYTPWNQTHEQIKYSIFLEEPHPTLDSWVLLNVNPNFTYQSVHPNSVNVTDEGNGTWNFTEAQHTDVFHHIWFLKPIDAGIGTNYSVTAYPVEILSWNNSAEQIRYSIYLANESFGGLIVEPNYTFQSVMPSLNVTLLDAVNGTYNLTERIRDFEWYELWFLRPKEITTSYIHIRLWHSTLGEGQPSWRWKCTINDGDSYNDTAAQWVYDINNWPVTYGNNYTIAVLDFFDNMITNYSFSATAMDINLLIPINIFTLQVVNYRQGTSHLSIFFNATGTPYSWPIVANDIFYLPIREGDYMFRITPFYWTADNTSEYAGAPIFYNLTIDADFNFYIGTSFIAITYWNTEGIEVDVNTIIDVFGPDQVIILNEPALSPTEFVEPGYETPFFLDPWYVISATIRNSETDNATGPASVAIGGLDTSLMAGTVLFLKDLLSVSASNTSAQMLINNSDTSTNFINTTAPAGTDYDILLDYYAQRGANLTAWVENNPLSVNREIKYRQSQRFWWEHFPNQNYYIATITVNNSLSQQILEPHVFVAFDNGTNPDLDSVRVYDQNNNRYLDKGTGYAVDYTGISFMFVNLSSGSQRSFTIDYYGDNGTRTGEEWIDAEQPPQPIRYKGTTYQFVFGTYTNREEGDFEGTIKFSLDFAGASDILPETIIVQNRATGAELVKHFHWRYTAAAIEIVPAYVGSISPGETISIGVYYLTEEEMAGGFFDTEVALGFTLPEIMLFIGLIGIIIGLLARSSKDEENKKLGTTWINVGILILSALAAIGLFLIAFA